MSIVKNTLRGRSKLTTVFYPLSHFIDGGLFMGDTNPLIEIMESNERIGRVVQHYRRDPQQGSEV
jgi:hypothetical protein